MSASAGPDIIEDGIVFYYDTGNTVKSYIGEPLVNCATDLSSGYNVTVTEVTDGSITPPFPGMRVYKFVTANDYNLHRQGGYYNGGGFGGSNPHPLILGTTTPSNFTTVGTGKYRFGMYIRGEVTNQVGDGVTIDIGDRNQVGTTVGTNTNWQLLQTNDTLGIANSDYPYDFFDIGASFNMTFYVAGYGIWRSPGTVTNLPFLQAYPIGTQYITYGQSRSVTEGLLDMTRNSTVNLTDVSFNSNAQIIFDGTNDSLVVGNNATLKNNNTSIEFVINYLNTPNGDIIQFGVGSGTYAQYYYRAYSGYSFWNWYPVGTGYGEIAIPNSALPLNTYHHIVMTGNDQGYVQFYINGIAQTGATRTSNTQPSNWTPADLTVGGFSWDGYSSSVIPLVKIYNRVLSASEVLTNYNAFKTRFGI
jgi:hypothetical protein